MKTTHENLLLDRDRKNIVPASCDNQLLHTPGDIQVPSAVHEPDVSTATRNMNKSHKKQHVTNVCSQPRSSTDSAVVAASCR